MTRKRKKVPASPDYAPAFGRRVREMLFALSRMRQADLAEKLGGRPDMVSRIVKGKNTGITYKTLGRLATFARDQGISLTWLFTGHGAIFRTQPNIPTTQQLLEASRSVLTVELARLISDHMFVEELLRTVDDPAARQEVIEAFNLETPEAAPASKKPARKSAPSSSDRPVNQPPNLISGHSSK